MTTPQTFQALGAVAARVVHRLNPRRNRDMERGRRAAAQVRASGGSAMAAAVAQIGDTFNQAAVVNAFKLRVERWLVLGADHPAVRARFGRRAGMLRNDNLDGAIIVVEHWYRTERKAFQIASAFGRGNSLSLEVLRELRLILRLIRATKPHVYRDVLAVVRGADPSLIAAE